MIKHILVSLVLILYFFLTMSQFFSRAPLLFILGIVFYLVLINLGLLVFSKKTKTNKYIFYFLAFLILFYGVATIIGTEVIYFMSRTSSLLFFIILAASLVFIRSVFQHFKKKITNKILFHRFLFIFLMLVIVTQLWVVSRTCGINTVPPQHSLDFSCGYASFYPQEIPGPSAFQ